MLVSIAKESPRKLISQQRLKMLRELRQKQDELKKLESRIAEKVISDLAEGAIVEPGVYQAKLTTRQRGNIRIQQLTVY